MHQTSVLFARILFTRIGLLLPLAFALAFSGCAVPVHTDFDSDADFAQMQTFAWLDPPLREAPREEGGGGVDPFTSNTLLDKRVRQAVEAALTERGYRAAGEEPADFQLRYEVVSREVLRDSPTFIGGGYGYRHYGTGVVYSGTTSYQEGTLILDVIDPATRGLAWRGWAASRTRDGHIDAARVEKTVDAILEKFPPGR
jgi:hypothetical protein